METTRGRPLLWTVCSVDLMRSEADALPPGLSTRRTIALVFSLSLACLISLARVLLPMVPGG